MQRLKEVQVHQIYPVINYSGHKEKGVAIFVNLDLILKIFKVLVVFTVL